MSQSQSLPFSKRLLAKLPFSQQFRVPDRDQKLSTLLSCLVTLVVSGTPHHQQHLPANGINVDAAVSAEAATDTSLVYCSFSTRPRLSWKPLCSRQQHRSWWTLWWQLSLDQQLRTHCLACLQNMWCRTTVLSCKLTGALPNLQWGCMLLHGRVCCLCCLCCMQPVLVFLLCCAFASGMHLTVCIMPQQLTGKRDAQDTPDLLLSQIMMIHNPLSFLVLSQLAVALTGFPVLTESPVVARTRVQTVDMRQSHKWYPMARSLQRRIIYHAGPTNSGKTYQALKVWHWFAQQLCASVLCCAVLCCAVLCCAVLCCAVLCCAVLGRAGLGWSVLCCHALSCAPMCCVVCCCHLVLRLDCNRHLHAEACMHVFLANLCTAVVHNGKH